MLRYSAWILLATVGGWFAYCSGRIPAGPDADVANAVGKYVSQGYGKFEFRSQVEKSARGKIYYVLPGPDQTPTLIFYEITSPEEVATIEALATKALRTIPEVKAIKLEFHEKQNLIFHANGGVSRGREIPFKRQRVTR